MKVSYNWLKELVDLNGIDRDKFVHDLSLHVVEVDGVENLEKATNLVVGEVLEKVKHPDKSNQGDKNLYLENENTLMK